METRWFDSDMPVELQLFANDRVEFAPEKFVNSPNDFSCSLKARMLRALRFGNPFRAYRNTELKFLKSKRFLEP